MKAPKLLLTTLSTVASLLVGCGSMNLEKANAAAPKGTGFMVKTVTVNNETRNYGLFIPHSYNPAKRWPVIVFLHGVLQAGSDGTSNIAVGMGPTIEKQADSYPFIVVFPQSGGDWKGDAHDRLAIATLDLVQREYSTDPSRVVLTGLSNGGYGVWHIGAMHPDRFSALVPVAGHTSYDDVPKLTNIPIWCIHNSGDFLVSPSAAREMCKRVNDAGGHAKFTERSAFGHGDWDGIYGDPLLLEWMLNQHRGGAQATGS